MFDGPSRQPPRRKEDYLDRVTSSPTFAVLWPVAIQSPAWRIASPDGEKIDLAEQYPSLRKQLEVRLREWDKTLKVRGLAASLHSDDERLFQNQ